MVVCSNLNHLGFDPKSIKALKEILSCKPVNSIALETTSPPKSRKLIS